MAKKPTEKQLYKLKNEWLGQFFEEVKPKEFYRAVFPEGSFERAGHFEDGKANGIITIVENDKAKNRIVFDDLSVIDEVKGAEFAVMSPVAYSGRNRTAATSIGTTVPHGRGNSQPKVVLHYHGRLCKA